MNTPNAMPDESARYFDALTTGHAGWVSFQCGASMAALMTRLIVSDARARAGEVGTPCPLGRTTVRGLTEIQYPRG